MLRLMQEIYGPEGIRLLVETALQTTQTFLPFALTFVELKAGQSYPALVRSGAWTAGAYPLKHRVPWCVLKLRLQLTSLSWGFVFTEETPPKFSSEAALAAGVPRGSVIAELARGIRQELTLDDGTVVRRESLLVETKLGAPLLTRTQVRGPLGRKIVILGDTCDSQGIAEAASGCDVRSRFIPSGLHRSRSCWFTKRRFIRVFRSAPSRQVTALVPWPLSSPPLFRRGSWC